MVKIALNIVKVGMQSYFPNPDSILWLNFNFEKLVKRETSLCCAKVGLKGGDNISQCLKSLHARLLIKLASKFMIKLNSKKLLGRETPSCGFNRVGLKGVKIAWNVTKGGVHACLSNMHPDIWSGLNSKNLVKAETASCSFVRVWLKDSENSSQHRQSWHALLFSKCGFESMINI